MLFGATFCFALLTTSAQAVDVRLRERVTPKSPVVRLGDVADVVSADRQEVRRMSAVPMMPAPAPGTERYLQKREVADMLAAAGVELSEVRFAGAEKIAVMGPGGAVVQAAYAVEASGAKPQAVTEATHTETAPAAHDARAAILAGGKVQQRAGQGVAAYAALDDARAEAINKQITVIIGEFLKTKRGGEAVGKIDCNATDRQLAQLATAMGTVTCNSGSEPWTGRQRIVMTFPTAEGEASVQISADVAEPAVPTVVAKRAVARGNIVTGADVEMRMIEPSARTSGARAAVISLDKAVGMEAKQALQVGEVVFADQVQAPLMIKRGDLVSVSTQSSGIRVRTTARALQDGATGDLIQVESLASKQRFDTRVTGLREATVFAPAKAETPRKPTDYETARRPFTSLRK